MEINIFHVIIVVLILMLPVVMLLSRRRQRRKIDAGGQSPGTQQDEVLKQILAEQQRTNQTLDKLSKAKET